MATDPTAGQLATLEDETARLAGWLIYYLRAVYQLPAVITEGSRTSRRQEFLFASGRTRPGPVLTGTLESSHLSGQAFDIDMFGHARDSVPLWVWDEVAGPLGEWLGLVWGGRWRSRDLGHFERRTA